MISLKTLGSTTFGVTTTFLSFLNLGVEGGTISPNIFFNNLTDIWGSFIDFALSPMKEVPLEGWNMGSQKVAALGCVIFVLIPFVLKFWSIKKSLVFGVAAFAVFMIIAIGLDSPPSSPDEVANPIPLILLLLLVLSFLVLVWYPQNIFWWPTKRKDAIEFKPVAQAIGAVWLNVGVAFLFIYILSLAGFIQILKIIV